MKPLKANSLIIFGFLFSFFLLTEANSQLQSSSGGGLFDNYSSVDVDLQLGTSFTTGFGGSSFLTHNIAPSLNWNASERFSVQAGTIFSSTSFSGQMQNNMLYGMETETGQALFQDNLYRNLSYAVGYYKVNENLTFMGGAYVESSNFDQQLQMNSQAFNLNAKGMVMGFDYKINDNMRFGAEINFRSGHSPYSYQYNPYSSPGFNQSPFRRSHFDSRTNW